MFRGIWFWLFPPIVPGDIWVMKGAHPWTTNTVEILDVGQGWVKYWYNNVKSPHLFMTSFEFRSCFSKKKGLQNVA